MSSKGAKVSSYKVLVLGASGMAGHVVALYLREQGLDVDTLSAKNALDDRTFLVDVLDADKFKSALSAHKYDVVINCIGLLVKQSEARKDLAVYLNSYLPHFLEHLYQDTSTKIIHLSTDAVFAKGTGPYKEKSTLGSSEGFYGLSKLLGEIDNDKDLNIRLSIIGPDLRSDGQGLFNWFMKQSGKISGYDKAFWSGVTTIELAKAIKSAIDNNVSGIYHLAPDANISKFELLRLLQQTFQRPSLKIDADSSVSLDRTMVSTRHDIKYQVADYPAMVQEMKEWIDNHKELYPHYLTEGVNGN